MNNKVLPFLLLISFGLNAQNDRKCVCSDVPPPKRFSKLGVNLLTSDEYNNQDLLMKAARAENPDKRAAAVRHLGQNKNPSSFSEIARAVGDDDCEVRVEAIKALGYFKTPATEQIFIKNKSDKSCYVREEIAYQLGAYQSKTSETALVDLAGDNVANVASQAINSLRKFKDVGLIPMLKKHLTGIDPKLRAAAVNSLSIFRTDTIANILVERQNDEDKHVRQALAYALMNFNSQKSLETLYLLLEDPDGQVQLGAIESITEIGDRHSVPFLIQNLQNQIARKNSVNRQMLIRALGILGTASVEPYLRNALHDENEIVRKTASEAIEKTNIKN